MNKLKSLVLYFCFVIALSVIPYVFFEGVNLIVALGVVVSIWTLIYFYIDKILLFQLDAREVIDTDQQELFQFLKNKSYTSAEKTPKVYLYSGSGFGCFIFESRSNWNLVLDRKLLKIIEIDQMESFVDFLFAYKKTGRVWLQTKSIGICCIVFNSINWFLVNILRLDSQSNKYKVLSVTMLTFLRPLWSLVEAIARKENTIVVDKKMESIYLQSINENESSYDYLIGHIDAHKTIKKQIINYVEGFSVVRNCRFN